MYWRLRNAAALAAAALLAVALAACTTTLARYTDPPDTTSIFVASLRGVSPEAPGMVVRQRLPAFSVHDVSVPPKRPLGQVSRNGADRNPRSDFLDLGAREFAGAKAMTAALATKARALGTPGQVMVFVHGFNNSFDHGLKRIAEIDTDYIAPIAKLLFDWPTDDELLDYGHDLDSARFSRDGLEQVIEALDRSGFTRIVLVGYSMGADIVLETLRQMRIGGKDRALSRIGGVAFIAPDVDIDVFTQDARRIAPLPQPFVVYSSPDDWPLRALQKYVYSDKPRLGTIDNLDAIAGLPVTVITAPTSGEPAEARHLISASLSVIRAANAGHADLASFAEIAANAPGAAVARNGKAVRIDLP